MGILANHVPSVEALKAGVVEVIEDAGSQSKKWFSKSFELVKIGKGEHRKEARRDRMELNDMMEESHGRAVAAQHIKPIFTLSLSCSSSSAL